MVRRSTRWQETWDDFELWMGLTGFAREVRFRGLSGKRQFRFDFAHEDARLAVEYDGIGITGDITAKGGHQTQSGMTADHEKSNEAQLLGWRVLRCNRKTVDDGRCIRWVEIALDLPEHRVIQT